MVLGKALDLMVEGVATLQPGDNIAMLNDLMSSRQIRHVPIVDSDGDLVGLVSHRDMLRHVLSNASELPMSAQRELLRHIRVEEIMIADPETTEPDSDLYDAAQVMLENKYGCLPVVEGARLVGILTEADFVRYVAERICRPREGG